MKALSISLITIALLGALAAAYTAWVHQSFQEFITGGVPSLILLACVDYIKKQQKDKQKREQERMTCQ